MTIIFVDCSNDNIEQFYIKKVDSSCLNLLNIKSYVISSSDIFVQQLHTRTSRGYQTRWFIVSRTLVHFAHFFDTYVPVLCSASFFYTSNIYIVLFLFNALSYFYIICIKCTTDILFLLWTWYISQQLLDFTIVLLYNHLCFCSFAYYLVKLCFFFVLSLSHNHSILIILSPFSSIYTFF